MKCSKRSSAASTCCKTCSERVERLKADLTAQEVEDPEKLRENLLRQRQEILARIQSEAERHPGLAREDRRPGEGVPPAP